MADYPDNDRRPYIQPHPPYYDFASYTPKCTSASQFCSSNPLPTCNTSSASNHDIPMAARELYLPRIFQPLPSRLIRIPEHVQNTFHPLETRYPSDHLQPQYESAILACATTSDTYVDPATPTYHNRDSVPYLMHHPSAPLFGFTLPVPEATQQYQCVNQTNVELGLAAWHEYWQPQRQEPNGRLMGHLPYLPGDNNLYVLDGKLESLTRSSSSPTPVLEYPPLDSYPGETAYRSPAYRSSAKYTAIAPSHPAQPSIDAPAYEMHHNITSAYPKGHFHQQDVYQHTTSPQHEYRQSQGQEPDGLVMGHLPYLKGDNTHASDGQPESPTRSTSASTSVILPNH